MEINNKPLTAAEILALAIPTQFSVQEYLDHRDDWVQVGTRFPRLTAPRPLLRLREIVSFLSNLT